WRVKDINPGLAPSDPRFFAELGGKLLFNATDNIHGSELWTSDGTDAGTTMVADLAPGLGSSNPWNLVASGGLVYFKAFNAAAGDERWSTNRTAAGTHMVKDIAPGSANGLGSGVVPGPYLTDVAGTVFFIANDGTTGMELWKSDGTAGGTVLVRDIVPGS